MERSEVYQLIDGEREYQENLGRARREPGQQRRALEMGEYITMLHGLIHQAQDEWLTKSKGGDSPAIMRKIAASAVRFMENHGAPPRISKRPSDVIGSL
jgi:hypothetical protein